jgi:putative transposase
MDGKGIATDNAFIERFLSTLKRMHISLNPAKDGCEHYSGVYKFMKKYNQKNHRAINRKKPQYLYLNAA